MIAKRESSLPDFLEVLRGFDAILAYTFLMSPAKDHLDEAAKAELSKFRSTMKLLGSIAAQDFDGFKSTTAFLCNPEAANLGDNDNIITLENKATHLSNALLFTQKFHDWASRKLVMKELPTDSKMIDDQTERMTSTIRRMIEDEMHLEIRPSQQFTLLLQKVGEALVAAQPPLPD